VWVPNYLLVVSSRALSLVWIVNFWGWVVNFILIIFFIFWMIEVLVWMLAIAKTVVREWNHTMLTPMAVSLEELSWSCMSLSMVAAKAVVFKAEICRIPRKVFVKKTFIEMSALKEFLCEVRSKAASLL